MSDTRTAIRRAPDLRNHEISIVARLRGLQAADVALPVTRALIRALRQTSGHAEDQQSVRADDEQRRAVASVDAAVRAVLSPRADEDVATRAESVARALGSRRTTAEARAAAASEIGAWAATLPATVEDVTAASGPHAAERLVEDLGRHVAELATPGEKPSAATLQDLARRVREARELPQHLRDEVLEALVRRTRDALDSALARAVAATLASPGVLQAPRDMLVTLRAEAAHARARIDGLIGEPGDASARSLRTLEAHLARRVEAADRRTLVITRGGLRGDASWSPRLAAALGVAPASVDPAVLRVALDALYPDTDPRARLPRLLGSHEPLAAADLVDAVVTRVLPSIAAAEGALTDLLSGSEERHVASLLRGVAVRLPLARSARPREAVGLLLPVADSPRSEAVLTRIERVATDLGVSPQNVQRRRELREVVAYRLVYAWGRPECPEFDEEIRRLWGSLEAARASVPYVSPRRRGPAPGPGDATPAPGIRLPVENGRDAAETRALEPDALFERRP